jgi:hypothetical protein
MWTGATQVNHSCGATYLFVNTELKFDIELIVTRDIFNISADLGAIRGAENDRKAYVLG